MASARRQFARLRRAAGYTQESLAAALLVARITVYRWEAGLTVPHAGLLPDLAGLLGISSTELDALFRTSSTDATSARQRPALGAGAKPSADARSGRVVAESRDGQPFEVDDERSWEGAAPDLTAVAELRQVVRDIGYRYDQTPAASMLVDAGKALARVTGSVRDGARGRVRYELCAVEAEAATLAGKLIWDASQRRDHHSVRAYFQQAIDAAEEIGDTSAVRKIDCRLRRTGRLIKAIQVL
ncbi:helix-turn-helix domain-containing protein [Actinokineospora globicatena]|nr:helix-turn-helix transcriptional regulator [Actinokineospora globicatena]